MDRSRIIDKLKGEKLVVGDATYHVRRELGRGGNGVVFECAGGSREEVVAKIYVPPDSRDLDDRALERFNNEIQLTVRLRHPHIVESLGAAAVEVGAYKLPFYLMPLASSTMRKLVSVDTDAGAVEKKGRLFLHACYGVSCLHHHGVIHRDLKPENILIGKKGEPWVADLGIAHVNPDFVSVGLKTIASERLLNRDYYAPEQRFGAATEVDHRADIYALGCILYELLTSIPPVRSGAPPPSSIGSVFAPFDEIWLRMTAWKPVERYDALEYACEDISLALGGILAVLSGAPGARHPDLKVMTRLLRSRNEATRQQGIDVAARLGKAALAELHSMVGHGQREIRNSVALALGQIADASSLPSLVAGMYGNTEKAGHFRPATDTAAEAIGQYPVEDRIRALKMIQHPVRPAQLALIVKALPREAAYEAVLNLHEQKRLLLDYGETELELLTQIDEERAWPNVRALSGGGNDGQIRRVLDHLSDAHRLEILGDWIHRGPSWEHYFGVQIKAVEALDADASFKTQLLEDIERNLGSRSLKWEDRVRLTTQLERARRELDLPESRAS